MKTVKTSKLIKGRLLFVFGSIAILLFLLVFRLAWFQIIKSDYYSKKALKQQTSDSVVSAVRGDILDRNGKDLAISSTTNTIWVRPATVKKHGSSDAEIEGNARAEAEKLAEILELNADDVYSIITSDKTLVKVSKYVSAETAALVRAEKLSGIEITEEKTRNYPLGNFASHILGFTNDDNEGQNGLESYYNDVLSGTDGRYVTIKDRNQNSLIYGTSRYYDADNGLTLVTTVDEGIQYIVEQRLDEYKEITGAKRIMCIMMDPEDGGILAMAQTNDYDPNEPRVPTEMSTEEFSQLSSDEQVTYWYQMWRSFCISDTYEPGSTFKLITSSIALDTGSTYLGEKFVCNGYVTVKDRILKCWYYPRVHGVETLQQAIENSCNPVMVSLVQRIGLTQYFEGLDSFGLTAKTGIDYPGEASNIIYDSSQVGPVELATMAYGQGISVTPISLITAVSSLANGGYVMQPHFMKELLDSDGNVVEEYEPVVKGVSVSAQTASDILSIMELVVSEGGGGSAKITGYRIGGKTGTASKPVVGGYSDSDYMSSFIGVATVDDPQFVILVIVDAPQGKIYGSQTAAPCAKAIMADVLQYLNIKPNYSEKELASLNSKKTEVPDVVGQDADNAIGILAGKNLKYEFSPALSDDSATVMITDQFPKAGEEVAKDSLITLYYEVMEDTEEISEEETEENGSN